MSHPHNKQKSIAGSNNKSAEDMQKNCLRVFLESAFRDNSRNRIQVEVEKLRKFFAADKAASDVISEAVAFAKGEDTWRFWSCCCGRKFGDPSNYLQHFLEDHVETLPKPLKELIPERVSEEWAKKIEEESWKPIEVDVDPASVGAISESKDEVKTKLLVKISLLLRLTVAKNVLSQVQLDSMLMDAMEFAQGLPLWPLLKKNGADEKPLLCLRCFDAEHLRGINNFLVRLLRACRDDAESSIDWDEIIESPESGVVGRVLPNHIFSNIFFYADQLHKQSESKNCDPSRNDDVEAVISWLYDGPQAADGLQAWTKLKDARKRRCCEIFWMLIEEYHRLRTNCSIEDDRLIYKEALQTLRRMFDDEQKQRKNKAEHEFQSYEAILKKSNVIHRNAISDVLEEAEALKVSETRDCETSEEDELSIQYLLKKDNWVEKALTKCQKELDMEIPEIVAKLMVNASTIGELELRLVFASAFDYLTVLMPIVKTFLRACWEDAAEKFAKEKAEVVRAEKETTGEASNHKKALKISESKNETDNSKKV